MLPAAPPLPHRLYGEMGSGNADDGLPPPGRARGATSSSTYRPARIIGEGPVARKHHVGRLLHDGSGHRGRLLDAGGGAATAQQRQRSSITQASTVTVPERSGRPPRPTVCTSGSVSGTAAPDSTASRAVPPSESTHHATSLASSPWGQVEITTGEGEGADPSTLSPPWAADEEEGIAMGRTGWGTNVKRSLWTEEKDPRQHRRSSRRIGVDRFGQCVVRPVPRQIGVPSRPLSAWRKG